MSEQKDTGHDSAIVGSAPDSVNDPQKPDKSERTYEPHICLMTQIYTHGADLVALDGRISGLMIGASAWGADEGTKLIKVHVLPEIKKAIAALTKAVADYERRTFKMPRFSAEQYAALVKREKLGGAAS